jgi:CubicO group peptidase (beta-lactamase class C family)
MFNHKIIIIVGIIFLLIFSNNFNAANAISKQENRCIKNFNSDDFDDKIRGFMELGHFPSLVTCIVKNNTLTWSKGYGNSKIGFLFNKEVTTDTVFPMASISKSVAATAIMKLNEIGLISLDDKVSKYLPFDLKNPRYPDIKITPRMLLYHQSIINNPGQFSILNNDFIKNPLGHLE